MKKRTVKLLKPFSYDKKPRKKGDIIEMPTRFADALILIGKAEPYVEPPKKRTYRTRRSAPTKTTDMKADNELV